MPEERRRRRRWRNRDEDGPRPPYLAAAYFLMHSPSWVQRHVETYVLEGLRSARRHLTIDLTLPDDPEAIRSKQDPSVIESLKAIVEEEKRELEGRLERDTEDGDGQREGSSGDVRRGLFGLFAR